MTSVHARFSFLVALVIALTSSAAFAEGEAKRPKAEKARVGQKAAEKAAAKADAQPKPGPGKKADARTGEGLPAKADGKKEEPPAKPKEEKPAVPPQPDTRTKEEKEMGDPVTLSDVPDGVRTTIEIESEGNQIHSIGKVNRGKVTVFRVDFDYQETSHRIIVDNDGTLINRAEVPKPKEKDKGFR